MDPNAKPQFESDKEVYNRLLAENDSRKWKHPALREANEMAIRNNILLLEHIEAQKAGLVTHQQLTETYGNNIIAIANKVRPVLNVSDQKEFLSNLRATLRNGRFPEEYIERLPPVLEHADDFEQMAITSSTQPSSADDQ